MAYLALRDAIVNLDMVTDIKLGTVSGEFGSGNKRAIQIWMDGRHSRTVIDRPAYEIHYQTAAGAQKALDKIKTYLFKGINLIDPFSHSF